MRSVPMRLLFTSLPLLLPLALSAPALHAQDTRTVTEPKIPPACVTLQADVVANQGVIALADEQKLSTARIEIPHPPRPRQEKRLSHRTAHAPPRSNPRRQQEHCARSLA